MARPLETLICWSQVRVPWGQWINSTDCGFKGIVKPQKREGGVESGIIRTVTISHTIADVF